MTQWSQTWMEFLTVEPCGLLAPLLQYVSLRNFHSLHKLPFQPFGRVMGYLVMSEQA